MCSTRNLDLVRSLGADHVIDYPQEALGQKGAHFDLIIDNVGILPVSDYQPLLSAKGQCIVPGFEAMGQLFQVMFQGGWVSLTGSRKIHVMNANTNHEGLDFIKGLIVH